MATDGRWERHLAEDLFPKVLTTNAPGGAYLTPLFLLILTGRKLLISNS